MMIMKIKCPGKTHNRQYHKMSNQLFKTILLHKQIAEGRPGLFLSTVGLLYHVYTVMIRSSHNTSLQHQMIEISPIERLALDKNELEQAAMRKCKFCIAALTHNSLFQNEPNVKLFDQFINLFEKSLLYSKAYTKQYIINDKWHNGYINIQTIEDRLDELLYDSNSCTQN